LDDAKRALVWNGSERGNGQGRARIEERKGKEGERWMKDGEGGRR